MTTANANNRGLYTRIPVNIIDNLYWVPAEQEAKHKE